MGPEAKFYKEIKRKLPEFSFVRIENSSLLGTPDLLVYNTSGHFCTLELKVSKGKKIRFSPHQIAFHKRHPDNTFILVKSLATRDWKLYEGKVIRELVACGLKLDACCSGPAACRLMLASLGA